MTPASRLAWACVLLAAMEGSAVAEQYFVNKRGNDAHDGLTRETAFLTIQKGVDALQPGDTLTIGPGEYFEAVSRADLGNTEAETVIRARIPGTVLLRGDVPVGDFKKVDGYRFISVTDFDRQPYSVAEVDGLRLMNEALYIDELEFLPGTFYYDAEEGKLYISSADLQAPGSHHYRASVIPQHGLYLKAPVRVTVQGIGVTGFNFNEALPSKDGFGARWGIHFGNATRCAIRGCTAFLNGGGLLIMGDGRGGHNVIEGCTAYANGSRHGNEGGNIAIIRGGPGDVFRGNYVYLSSGYGQRFYIGRKPDMLMADSVAWGNQAGDLWIKGVRAAYRAERLVSTGLVPRNARDSLSGHTSDRLPDTHNTLFLGDHKDLDPEAEFADPVHFDFRLQSTSRFRGAGPDGRDQGPFPFAGDVCFVRADGDDAADGLSVAHAWRTLSRAVPALKKGDTLYLLRGAYRENLSVSLEGVSIRGRGSEPVVLGGDWHVANAADVSFERLTFTGKLSLAGGGNLSLDNCAFVAGGELTVSGVAGVRITHGVFKQTLSLAASSGVYLSGNLFAASPAVAVNSSDAILFSDYNSYPGSSGTWSVAGALRDLKDVRGAHDRYSIVARPEIEFTGGAVALRNRTAFAAAGPMGTAIGLYFEGDKRHLRLEGPFVRSVGDTTADVEWWTSHPAVSEFAWGETPAVENRLQIPHHNFAGYSLAGLEPGKTYYYQVRLLEPFPGLASSDWVELDSKRAIAGTFTTRKEARKPQTWYVGTDGNNGNDGLSRETAWRTLNYAAGKVGPGDTMLVAGGRYHETVWLRATGEKDRPITFRAMPGERVVFDGISRKLFAAFVGHGKHHYVFDSFYAENLGHIRARGGSLLTVDLGGMFALAFCRNVEVHRCLLDGRGIMYSPSFLTAESCADILLKNCVVMGGMDRARIVNSPRVRVENSVFFRNLISHLLIENHGDQPVRVANSIFTDSLSRKFGAAMIVAARMRCLSESNNCFFPREPQQEKRIFMFYSDDAFERARVAFMMGEPREQYPVMTEIHSIRFGQIAEFLGKTDSIIANPDFRVLADVPAMNARGEAVYPVDRLPAGPVDFSDFFATNPEVVKRDIGLQREAFQDFHFNRP